MSLFHEGGFFVEDEKDQQLMYQYLRDLQNVVFTKVEREGKITEAIWQLMKTTLTNYEKSFSKLKTGIEDFMKTLKE